MSERNADVTIRLHRFLPMTEAEGPGRRAAIWVQGCPIHCHGCFNHQTWSPQGGYGRTVHDLFREISAQPDLEGVTFTGGEPFAQAGPLARLGRLCRDAGLSVVTYTGYEHNRLRRSKRAHWQALLDVTDILLAGPFVRKLADSSRPWVGSSNQEFVFLTGRYRQLKQRIGLPANQIEVRVADHSISLNGTAPEDEIFAVRKHLAQLGLCLTHQRSSETCQR